MLRQNLSGRLTSYDVRGQTFLMGDSRPEHFFSNMPFFSDPLNFCFSISDPLFFPEKILDPLRLVHIWLYLLRHSTSSTFPAPTISNTHSGLKCEQKDVWDSGMNKVCTRVAVKSCSQTRFYDTSSSKHKHIDKNSSRLRRNWPSKTYSFFLVRIVFIKSPHWCILGWK